MLLCLCNAASGERCRSALFIHDIIRVDSFILFLFVISGHDNLLFQATDEFICLLIKIGGLIPFAGDNEGSSGFIDQDRVYLVDDSKHMATLNQFIVIDSHIVAQVVESHFIVCAICDIRCISLLPGGVVQIMDDQADGQAQKTIDFSHPFTIALGQVVINCYDVDAFPVQRIQISRKSSYQCFPFAGFHFGNSSLVEDDAADKLNAKMPHSQHTVGSFPHRGKRIRKNVIQRLPCLKS